MQRRIEPEAAHALDADEEGGNEGANARSLLRPGHRRPPSPRLGSRKRRKLPTTQSFRGKKVVESNASSKGWAFWKGNKHNHGLSVVLAAQKADGTLLANIRHNNKDGGSGKDIGNLPRTSAKVSPVESAGEDADGDEAMAGETQ